jgi:hypothetical protein
VDLVRLRRSRSHLVVSLTIGRSLPILLEVKMKLILAVGFMILVIKAYSEAGGTDDLD